jgi:hypothetical protein
MGSVPLCSRRAVRPLSRASRFRRRGQPVSAAANRVPARNEVPGSPGCASSRAHRQKLNLSTGEVTVCRRHRSPGDGDNSRPVEAASRSSSLLSRASWHQVSSPAGV